MIVPTEHKEIIVSNYLSGKTTKESVQQFGYSIQTCYNVLKKYNIETRGGNRSKKKYKFDEDFFNRIDTEEKAYWLGFLTADGNLATNRFTICVALKISDKNHLQKFLDIINHKTKIYEGHSFIGNKEYKYAKFAICSKIMYNDLLNLGLTPCKSLTVTKPIFDNKFEKYFWRGYFDGDGSISIMKKGKFKKETCSVSICGTENICESFKIFLKEKMTFKANVRKIKRSKIFSFTIAGIRSPKKVMDIIYKDPNIFLDRKKELVDKLRSLKEKNYKMVFIADGMGREERGYGLGPNDMPMLAQPPILVQQEKYPQQQPTQPLI